jgi:adenylate kinase
VRRIISQGQGVIFDGSPRTLFEAEELLKALPPEARRRALVVFLDVPKPETLHRITRRWVCAGCRNATPNADNVPQACAECGGKLERRPDDTPEVLDTRWEEYVFRTLPVIEFLGRQGLVARVNGHQPPSDVTDDVRTVLRERLGL